MVRANVDVTVGRLVANLLRIVLLIALALQNTLENLISGVLILLRKPYDRGEVIGIDDRNDHVAATDILMQATLSVEQVMEEPEPRVFLVGLGDSSVDYIIRFWTEADLLIGVTARDGVLSACKTALEEAGMTIPWPIRTLAADMQPLQVEQGRTNGRAAADDDAVKLPGT